MRLLITGGCGFIGSNVAERALKAGYEVTLFDNFARVGSRSNLEFLRSQGEFRLFEGDIRQAEEVSRVLREVRPEIIFHLSGQVAMTTSIADPRADFEINVLGAINVLEAVRQYTPDAVIVFSSTNKVYGDLEEIRYEETPRRYLAPEYPNGFDERLPLNFHSPYGCSKGAADQYMLDYARIFGLRTVVFRHSSIFGEHQHSTFDQGWVGWFMRETIRQKADPGAEPFTISGNGKQVRDLLFSSDLVTCYFEVVKHIDRAAGQAFNIGGGADNSISLLELFAFLEDRMGVAPRFVQRPWRESDQKVFVADTSKARELFGWQPHVGKLEGMDRMLNWIRNHG
jgi:CDP-paratose 2-epimerase